MAFSPLHGRRDLCRVQRLTRVRSRALPAKRWMAHRGPCRRRGRRRPRSLFFTSMWRRRRRWSVAGWAAVEHRAALAARAARQQSDDDGRGRARTIMRSFLAVFLTVRRAAQGDDPVADMLAGAGTRRRPRKTVLMHRRRSSARRLRWESVRMGSGMPAGCEDVAGEEVGRQEGRQDGRQGRQRMVLAMEEMKRRDQGR
jgi:hypothetical protein